ncbi:hypothetical protein HPB48_004924 [Haemaphysalis longicornis]|uniref:Beta-N-acetylhexosaminidase n=1 Tax=Haemaphysalis longicornis TaxID=44386 RepID=A0A9J6GDL0_HAELO|nr:hypothetical protein HPB48_004924 [Haemaphysalis longicornis]
MARAFLVVLLVPAIEAAISIIPPHRLVHLDLKGAPPKASYLITIMPVLKKLGATGLLVEYEDTFPFVGEPLHALASSEAYTRQELRAVLDAASDHGLTVVPMVNTFDKLEYVLKHPQFAKYRESSTSPGSLCPSNPAGVKLMTDILDQILHFHHARELYYVHIGCGDVAALGVCSLCKARRFRHPTSNDTRSLGRFGLYDKYMLYMSYVQLITDYVKERHGVKTIVWHDTLSRIPNELYRLLPINLHVEVMMATHRMDLEFSAWLNFASRFGDSLWMATSFKEVDEAPALYPVLKSRVRSHVEWIGAMAEWKDHVRFPGVALMGPQQSSHGAPLRELLPVSLPSLAVCLAVIRKAGKLPGVKGDFTPIEQVLACNRTINTDDETNVQGVNCGFPGSSIVREIGSLETLRHHVNLLPHLASCKQNDHQGSRSNGKDCDKNLHAQLAELLVLHRTLRKALQEVYSDDVANQYAKVAVAPLMSDIKHKQAILRSQGSLRSLLSSTPGDL